MDLFCAETMMVPPPAPLRLEVESVCDEVLLRDERVLYNMLVAEREFTINNYCSTVQTSVKPHMRKIVTDWMSEVCQDQQCQPEVFCHAVNYLDRFLTRVNINKTQFQLLASVCLLLASKFTEVVPLSTETIVLYTDNSVTVQELRDWEMKVLNCLGWELSTITPITFLQYLLPSLPNISTSIRRLSETLAISVTTHYDLLMVKPSLLSAACIAMASNSPAVLKQLAARIRQPEQHLIDIIGYISNNVTDLRHCGQEEERAAMLPPFHTVAKTSGNGSSTPTECLEIATAMAA